MRIQIRIKLEGIAWIRDPTSGRNRSDLRRKMNTGRGILTIAITFLLLVPASVYAQENALSFGYGFGFLNDHEHVGRIQDDRLYDFFQVAYSREIHLVQRFFLVLEPFVVYDHRPNGLDVGFAALFRYVVPLFGANSLFLDVGAGGALTTVNFKEQGTHALFTLQGGVGWRWKRFFIEDRFKHYSNGGLARPNYSVQSNLVVVGVYF
jgi:hypothetical protein